MVNPGKPSPRMPSNWKLLKGCDVISTATMMLILRLFQQLIAA